MKRFSLAAILVLSAALSALAQPREGETWYAYLNGDDRYGSECVRVERLEDGNYQYKSEHRMLIDLFGAQKQEIRGQTTVVVTPDFRLLSITTESSQMSGKTSATAEMKGNELVIRDGSGATSRVSFGEHEHVVVGHALGDWLAQRPKSEREIAATMIDATTTAVVKVTLTRKSANDWTLTYGDGHTTAELTFDDEGSLVESVYRSPALHIRRCTEAEAKDIDYFVMDGSEVLSFPIDADIPSAERLRSLTVRLEWKNIPLDEFELEDSRQKVLETSESSSGFSAKIALQAPPTIESPPAIPIDEANLRRFLAETPFIKPNDAEIRKAAKTIIGEETSSLEATRAISQWVHDYIDDALIAETLTGPQVLAGKQGKCTEYSTLFASLARSAGIPTRVALGERMLAGSWGGHMWNEVWVGEWIPVDASVDEVGGSFALLKFIHSDTVNGTQSLRWKLTESLAIKIEEFELDPLGLTEKIKTGIDGIVYANADFACRIRAPKSDWVLEDISDPGSPIVRFRVPGHEDADIHFVAFGLPPGTTPEAIIKARFNAFRAQFDPFEVHRDEPCDVNGAVGHRSRFGGPAKGDPSRTYHTTEVVWRTDLFGYLMNIVTPDKEHEALLPDFEKLVQSFESLTED